MKSGISLCMIVRNEERFLGDALASAAGVVDEICIVDTGSTDATVAIAERFGARIAHVAWTDDFAAARNASLALATHAWILVLDADERLAPDSRDALRALGRTRPDGRGRWIWCRNLIDAEREIPGSTNAIVRIFPNDDAIRYRGRLHEFVVRAGEGRSLPAERSTIEIVHYGYQQSLIAERDKGRRNFELSRAEVEANPSDPALVYNYAMSATMAGELDIARTQLESVIAMTESQPRGFRPQAMTVLSGIYLDAGRFAEALALAERCVAIVPTFPDGHYARGRALAALGRLYEARDAFGATIANGGSGHEHFVVDDELPAWKAHNELAGTLAREQRFADARRWLELALAQRPAERMLLNNRARCCEAMGDLSEALSTYRTAFATLLDDNAAIEYVNFVFRHAAPDACLAAVEETLPALHPGYRVVFLASAAAVMLRAGRHAEAATLVERVSTVRDDRAAAERIIDDLAARYATPALRALFAATEPLPAVSRGVA